tara:strand:- start:633 stop:857 length:225 start_codon:yes stop_codon:yes gene_type:complete
MQVKTTILSLLFYNFIFPCAVCYGNPEEPMSQGMSMGILTLLGFIVFILVIIATSMILFSLRIKKISNSKELKC